MKVSELIKGLENTKETYGDLPVSISMDVDKKITTSEQIFIGYGQFENGSAEINIRDFPY